MDAQGFSEAINGLNCDSEFRDPVVKRVVEKFRTRSNVGFEKYGTTLDEERTTEVKVL